MNALRGRRAPDFLRRARGRILGGAGVYLRRLGLLWGRRHSPNARQWSNAQLKTIAGLFEGDVINVSGWKDGDKEGSSYQQYFSRASSYVISNIPGERGATGSPGELLLDLEAGLPRHLHARFDVVFNHTTLEHVFDIRKAVQNLCTLSNDIVIVVVPWAQPVHFEAGAFGDYWRPSAQALQQMFKENGFEPLLITHNDNPFHFIYWFAVFSRRPEKWAEVLSLSPDAEGFIGVGGRPFRP